MITMNKNILVAILALVLILVVSCAPKLVPTTPASTGQAATSLEEQQIDSGLDDLNELDNLSTASQDVSFDDIDALGFGQ